ncbi:MAG: bifunctional phosphoribosylaminoimidazolecarboxamide formyltransferase/IMP cyclohydrolase [Acidobacteria bacterium]|nr:bifunctional phosphoribosylaminoimidazolecarboxamide formyltransferase/IMP cyclohydrolase [Acidobacteriota bacterium]
MSEEEREGVRRIGRALLSVSDKAGLIEFARELRAFGVELLSTGGTAAALRGAGLEVRDVSEVTGFPEMLDGRVKTLHPRIHGGLLAVRDNDEHSRALAEHGIEPIDMVVINLYPFEQTVARGGVTLAEAVEQVDIGGPAMVRSAAKNWEGVAVVTSPEMYEEIARELRERGGSLSRPTRARLSLMAYQRTSSYDAAIVEYLGSRHAETFGPSPAESSSNGSSSDLPPSLELSLAKAADLRYGENPHQRAALYLSGGPGVAAAEVLAGKEMSFNNYIDADAAWQLVTDFGETACAIIKHTNPAGCALGATPEEAYRRALSTDPVSAFGGIVAFNRTVDGPAARAVAEIFTEVVVAPDYDDAALEALRAKKNLRILRVRAGLTNTGAASAGDPFVSGGASAALDLKKISGGVLAQTRDERRLTRDALKAVTRRAPTGEELDALLFAWTVCKHTKSNAIVYARGGRTVGVGAGQMSRVDSVRIGAARAEGHGLKVGGSVLASDAFFPFRDGLDEAARHGITAIIQPGGSVRDAEVIAAADEHGLAMVFTGVRHFKH